MNIAHKFREFGVWIGLGMSSFTVLGYLLRWFPPFQAAITAILIVAGLVGVYLYVFYKNYRELAIALACIAVAGVAVSCL